MLFPTQKEKFLVLNNSNSSVLGEVLESDTGSVLSKAEEGMVAHRASQGMFRGLLLSPCICGEGFQIWRGRELMGRSDLGGKRSWLLLQQWS